MDRDVLLAGDVHDGGSAHPREDVLDVLEAVLGDVHHQVALVLGREHRLEGHPDLLDLLVVGDVRAGEQPYGRLQDVRDFRQAVHPQGRPGRGDVDDGVGDVDVRGEFCRARHLRDVHVDATLREEAPRDVRELGGDGAARQVFHGGDIAVLGSGEDQSAGSEPEVEQVDEVHLGLAGLVEAGDPDVGGAVGDVLGDVAGAGVEYRHVGVDRLGVQFAVGAVDDVQSCTVQQVDRGVVQATLVGDGDSHTPSGTAPGNCLSLSGEHRSNRTRRAAVPTTASTR